MSRVSLRLARIAVAVGLVALWHLLTSPTLLPPFLFDDPEQAARTFGRPLEVLGRIVDWFASGEILPHLAVTLSETGIAFTVGTVAGAILGLWLARSPRAADVLDPGPAGPGAMPVVILAPVFVAWLGLGIWSKAALGATVVFAVVFPRVYRGVRTVSPVVLASARMLGASRGQLLRHVYLPSAAGCTVSSLRTAAGLAFAAAVVGEYVGSRRGVGHLVVQAEAGFDIDTVVAGLLVLTALALLLDAAVQGVAQRLAKWREA